MASTPILNISEVDANQNQKTVTTNDAFNALEQVTNQRFDSLSVGAGPITLTEDQTTRNMVYKVAGASAAFELRFQSTVNGQNTQRLFTVHNADPTYTVTVRATTGSGSTVDVTAGNRSLVYQDNEDMYLIATNTLNAAFTDLTDTPSSLASNERKLLAINGAGNAIEFVDSGTLLDWKESVKAASTVSGTLATDFEDGDTLDGVTLATGDRILLKDQGTASENGIYTVNATGAPTRALDFDDDAEVTSGNIVAVEQGSTNGGILFLLTTANPITVGVTALSFSEVTGVQPANAQGTGRPAFRGALLNLSADENITSATIIPWDAQNYQVNTKDGYKFWLGVNATVTADFGNDEIDLVGHDMITGDGPFQFATTGTLPAGLSTSTDYWCIKITDDAFKVATSYANAIANSPEILSDAGTGTHTIDRETRFVIPNGVSKVRLDGGTIVNNLTDGDNSQLRLIKNGSGVFLGSSHNANEEGASGLTLSSPVLAVNAGDYFELQFESSDANVDLESDNTFFSIEAVEDSDTSPYDLSAFFGGTPAINSTIFRFEAVREFTLPQNLTGSKFKVGTNPSGVTVFDIQKNTVSVGSISVAVSGAVTFTFATDVSFDGASDDTLDIVTPGNLNGLADISFTLAGNR